MNNEPGSIIKLEEATRYLAEINSVDEVKAIRDKAEAMRVYARQAQLGLESQNYAAEIKIRAERRAGELLKEMADNGQRAKPGDITPSSGDLTMVKPTLSDLNISRNQSSNWQRIATIPQEQFEAHITETKEAGRELTTASVLLITQIPDVPVEDAGTGEIPEVLPVSQHQSGIPPIVIEVMPDTSSQSFNYKRDTKASRAMDEYTPKPYDTCQTPPYALEPLLPYLKTEWTIWEPAAGQMMLVDTLYDSFFDTVISTDILTGQNFLEYEPEQEWHCQVTNPPFSLKYPWLERSYELGKPFALLLPVETLGAKTAQELMKRYGFEVMLLNRRVNFHMPNKGWEGGGAQFPVMWLCWQLLPEKVVFGEINSGDYE